MPPLAELSVSPVLTSSSLPSATVSPALAEVSFGLVLAEHAVDARDLAPCRWPKARVPRRRRPCPTGCARSTACRHARCGSVFMTCTTVAVAVGDAEPLARRLDIRRVVADRLQQPQHAIALFGGADQHRRHRAVAQVGGEVVEHLVARRLDSPPAAAPSAGRHGRRASPASRSAPRSRAPSRRSGFRRPRSRRYSRQM